MTDAEQLAQVMQGNLAGQLSGGDKLMALSALLRSVSRGRTQNPEQVLQGLQQQKAQEIQSRIQIDQLRKQAEQQAQLATVKAQYVSELNQTNPQLARAIQLMTPEKFSDFIIAQGKAPEMTSIGRGLIEAGLAPGTPAFQAARKAALATPTALQTPQGTQIIQGVNVEETSSFKGKKYAKINGSWYLAE